MREDLMVQQQVKTIWQHMVGEYPQYGHTGTQYINTWMGNIPNMATQGRRIFPVWPHSDGEYS